MITHQDRIITAIQEAAAHNDELDFKRIANRHLPVFVDIATQRFAFEFEPSTTRLYLGQALTPLHREEFAAYLEQFAAQTIQALYRITGWEEDYNVRRNTDYILLDGEEIPDMLRLPKFTPGSKNRLSAMRLLNLAATSRPDDFRRLFNRAGVGRKTAATVLIWAGYDVESLLGWTQGPSRGTVRDLNIF
jgi:hypothetical protein